MLSTMILALAMTAQAPSAPKSDAELRAIAARVHQEMEEKNPYIARPTARPSKRPEAPAAYDRKAQLRRQVAEQERRDAIAAQRYQIEARAQYERMLPYMLENQRQQYNRMSAMERNAIAQQNAETYRQSMMWLQYDAMRRPR
jgi:hypothetical protein